MMTPALASKSVCHQRKIHAFDLLTSLLSNLSIQHVIHENWDSLFSCVMRKFFWTSFVETFVMGGAPYIFERRLFQRVLQCFVVLYRFYRFNMKTEIGVVIQYLLLSILRSESCTTSQRIDVLQALSLIFSISPSEPISMFINFDNRKMHNFSLSPPLIVFQESISTFSKLADGTLKPVQSAFVSPTAFSSFESSRSFTYSSKELNSKGLKRLSLELLTSVVQSLSKWLLVQDLMEIRQSRKSSQSLILPFSPVSRGSTPSSTSPRFDDKIISTRRTSFFAALSPERSPEQVMSRIRTRRSSSWRQVYERRHQSETIMKQAVVIANTKSLTDAVRYVFLASRTGMKSCCELPSPNPSIKGSSGLSNPLRDIAVFLHCNEALDQREIGLFLGSESDDVFSKSDFSEIRTWFMKLLDFSNMSFARALRYFVNDCGFILPESHNKRNILLTCFGNAYCRDNLGIFNNAVAASELAQVSIVFDTWFHSTVRMLPDAMLLEDGDIQHSSRPSASEFIKVLNASVHTEDMPPQQELLALFADLEKNPIVLFPIVKKKKLNKKLSIDSPRKHLRKISGTRLLGRISGESTSHPLREFTSTSSVLLSGMEDSDFPEADLRKECEIFVHRALAHMNFEFACSSSWTHPTSIRVVNGMFEQTWYRFLGCYSALVDDCLGITSSSESRDESLFISLGAVCVRNIDILFICLNGVVYCATIAVLFDMAEEACTFMSVLAKVSYLINSKESPDEAQKNIINGVYLKQKWVSVITSVGGTFSPL